MRITKYQDKIKKLCGSKKELETFISYCDLCGYKFVKYKYIETDKKMGYLQISTGSVHYINEMPFVDSFLKIYNKK